MNEIFLFLFYDYEDDGGPGTIKPNKQMKKIAKISTKNFLAH